MHTNFFIYIFYAVKLPSDVMLDGSFDGDEGSSCSRSTVTRDLLQWAVGWQQRRRMRKVEVETLFAPLNSTGAARECVSVVEI